MKTQTAIRAGLSPEQKQHLTISQVSLSPEQKQLDSLQLTTKLGG